MHDAAAVLEACWVVSVAATGRVRRCWLVPVGSESSSLPAVLYFGPVGYRFSAPRRDLAKFCAPVCRSVAARGQL